MEYVFHIVWLLLDWLHTLFLQVIDAVTELVNSATCSGSTPLQFAIKRGHFEASQMLINQGRADCTVLDEHVG